MAWIKKLVGFVGAIMVVAGCSKTEQPKDADMAVLYGPPPRFDENLSEIDAKEASEDDVTQDDIDALNHAANADIDTGMDLYGPPPMFDEEEDPENDGERITQDDIDALRNFANPTGLYGPPSAFNKDERIRF